MAQIPVNVSRAPGVPDVVFAAGVSAGLSLLTTDGAGVFGVFAPGQWGIYSGGLPVVVADSVISLEYKQEWTISDYPVEQGGFESFDKVALPFDARVRFSAGGSELSREVLLSSIAAIAGTLELFSVVTPEVFYPNVTIRHYDYRRTSTNGLGLIIVDVWCEEVRQSANTDATSTASFDGSATSQSSGASQINGGTVQSPPLPASGAGQVPQTVGLQ